FIIRAIGGLGVPTSPAPHECGPHRDPGRGPLVLPRFPGVMRPREPRSVGVGPTSAPSRPGLGRDRRPRRAWPETLVSAFILALAFLPLFLPSHSSSTTAPATSFAAHSAGLPAGRFVANVGQLGNKDIIYYAAGRDSAVGFLKDAVILMITDGHPEPPPRLGRPWTDAVDAPAHGVAVRIAFAGANAVSPTGREELPYRTNFFIGGDPGGWRTGVRTYHEVVYRNLYDGIDLVYRASESGLKYDL